MWVYPRGLALFVRLRLQVVEDADGPALADKKVNDVGADEACASRDEGAFLVCGH